MNRLLLTLLFIPQLLMAKVDVANLKTENLVNPLGIDVEAPRFSWQITSDMQDVVQQAYQIIVSSDGQEIWNSGKVASNQQLWIPYQGTALKSNQHCSWQVKVFTNKGESAWSSPQQFSMGLLNESKWKGRWIGLERLQADEHRGKHARLAARYLRHEFSLSKQVKRATAFVAGLGLYELRLNGEKVGNEVLTPVPSDYRKTIYYNTYDVTSLLQKDNCIGIILGNGRWFAMRQDKPYKNTTFGLPKCRINLIVEYTDGSKDCIQTDEKWKITTDGPIRANNEYDGEEYDARKEMQGWDSFGFDDSKWLQAERAALPTGTLRAQMTPSMKSTLPRKGKGSGIIDFGQNLA